MRKVSPSRNSLGYFGRLVSLRSRLRFLSPTMLLSCLLVIGVTQVSKAQGTLYFNAHLTGNNDYSGNGTFSLTTNYFMYRVLTAYGFLEGQIRSPWPDSNAPVIFNLHFAGGQPPLGGFTNGYSEFRGHFVLSDSQIEDLQSAKWYVYLPATPPYYLQGQIIPIPEPAISISFCLGVAALWFVRKLRLVSKCSLNTDNGPACKVLRRAPRYNRLVSWSVWSA